MEDGPMPTIEEFMLQHGAGRDGVADRSRLALVEGRHSSIWLCPDGSRISLTSGVMWDSSQDTEERRLQYVLEYRTARWREADEGRKALDAYIRGFMSDKPFNWRSDWGPMPKQTDCYGFPYWPALLKRLENISQLRKWVLEDVKEEIENLPTNKAARESAELALQADAQGDLALWERRRVARQEAERRLANGERDLNFAALPGALPVMDNLQSAFNAMRDRAAGLKMWTGPIGETNAELTQEDNDGLDRRGGPTQEGPRDAEVVSATPSGAGPQASDPGPGGSTTAELHPHVDDVPASPPSESPGGAGDGDAGLPPQKRRRVGKGN
jgi:hypothetical protein